MNSGKDAAEERQERGAVNDKVKPCLMQQH